MAIFQNTKIFFHFHVYYLEAWNENVNYRDSLFFIFMHQSIPAAPIPPGLLRGICQPCQSRGWGICKFCAVRGPGICQPRGQPWAFDTHAVSCQNITTQRILLEEQADWLIWQGRVKIEEVFKGMFSIYPCISSFLHCISWSLFFFFWITSFKNLINRQLNTKRTASQNHASFEFRLFVTLAGSFDLWTRSLGAIYFWELGMTIHHLGLFFGQWRVFSEGWLIFGEFGCFWKKKPQRIQFVKSKKLCRLKVVLVSKTKHS